MCIMRNPSVHVHLAVLFLKWCIFCLSLPRCPLFWSVWTRQITPHADVSMSEDGSGNECCKCFSEVTVDLTTNTDVSDPRGNSLCAPMSSQFLYLLGYFSLSPCFFFPVNFFHQQWPSLSGSPQAVLNRSIGSISLISQPTHGILATFFSL